MCGVLEEISTQKFCQERYRKTLHLSYACAWLWPQELVSDAVTFPGKRVRHEDLISPHIAQLLFFLVLLGNKAFLTLHMDPYHLIRLFGERASSLYLLMAIWVLRQILQEEESDIFNVGLFNFSTYNLGLIILICRHLEVFFVKFFGDFDVWGLSQWLFLFL